MNTQKNTKSISPGYARHHSRKRSKHSKASLLWKKLLKWIAVHPDKVIGFLCACIIIYLTILYFEDYNERKRSGVQPIHIESE